MTASRPLLGKVALVTGAARRIGRETALALADGGAHVAIHARQSLREADALARRIRRGGRRAAVLAADLADPDQCERLVPACVKALGRLDVLVNNAAIFEATDPRRADAAAFDRHMAVNARAVYLLCSAAGRWMERHGGGAIVNIACVSALVPWPGFLPYAASKAAVVNLTRGFAKAFAPRVRVNAVAPGPILPAEGASARRNRAAVEATLLKRWGGPADNAEAVRYLAEADLITGIVLPVDGGRHIA